MTERSEPKAQLCASNNVDWYGAVLATHGLKGQAVDGVFCCSGRVPPYYSNAVAYRPMDANAQLKVIKALAAELDRPFTVNDGYARLDLAPLGFRVLFEAQWIWRDAAEMQSAPMRSSWQRVAGARELAQWQEAWRAFGSPTDRPVFLSSLLENPSIAIFVAREEGKIIGVFAANRSVSVVGLSNFFAASGADSLELLRSALDVLSGFAPGLPVVGYEHGEALEIARRAGFDTVGPLRIWIRGP